MVAVQRRIEIRTSLGLKRASEQLNQLGLEQLPDGKDVAVNDGLL